MILSEKSATFRDHALIPCLFLTLVKAKAAPSAAAQASNERPRGDLAQGDVGVAVCGDVGLGALSRRKIPGRTDRVLPLRLRHPAGGADLCLAQRARRSRAHG